MEIPVYPNAPTLMTDQESHRRLLAESINSVINGALNVVLDITLAHDEAFTVLSDPRVHTFCTLIFEPTTTNAAAVQSSIWTSDKTTGSVKINHTSDANTDKSYRITILG